MVLYSPPKSMQEVYQSELAIQERLRRYYKAVAYSAVAAEMEKILREIDPLRSIEETPEMVVAELEFKRAA